MASSHTLSTTEIMQPAMSMTSTSPTPGLFVDASTLPDNHSAEQLPAVVDGPFPDRRVFDEANINIDENSYALVVATRGPVNVDSLNEQAQLRAEMEMIQARVYSHLHAVTQWCEGHKQSVLRVRRQTEEIKTRTQEIKERTQEIKERIEEAASQVRMMKEERRETRRQLSTVEESVWRVRDQHKEIRRGIQEVRDQHNEIRGQQKEICRRVQAVSEDMAGIRVSMGLQDVTDVVRMTNRPQNVRGAQRISDDDSVDSDSSLDA